MKVKKRSAVHVSSESDMEQEGQTSPILSELEDGI